MITLFIYGNQNNKSQLLRKVEVSNTCKGVKKNGRFDLQWFKDLASTYEPNMTNIWVK